MALRVVERQRPGVGGDVADQALADPQARAVHGRGIEALGGEQLEHLAGAQQVDRAHLGHHLVGDQAHDLAQRFLGSPPRAIVSRSRLRSIRGPARGVALSMVRPLDA